MIEVLRHFFGLCGEHSHPNIFTLILGGTGATSAIVYVRYKYFGGIKLKK